MKKTLLTLVTLLLSAIPVFGQEPATQISDANHGDIAWMLTSTSLVLLMVPGLAMFYGGLVRTKNVIGTMMHSYSAMALIGVLWVTCGYSMSFGTGVFGGWFGWDSKFLLLHGLDSSIRPDGIPDLLFAMFQGKFAIITPALIAGAFAERIKFKGYLLLITLWSLFVYNPLCHWVWASDGFLFKMGAIDFAGGTVVHISSGLSALLLALYIGKRRRYPKTAMHPNNLVLTLMGAGLLWVGWFGFNAGSAVSSGLKTAQALTMTQIAGASGALMWMLIESIHQGKATALGVASGILAGLVAVTPGAGDVTTLGAMILGFTASLCCYSAILAKSKFGYDDSLDAFGVHGVGGIVGALALSFFLRDETKSVIEQFGIQALAVLVAIVYSLLVTLIIAFIVDKLVGLRASVEEEQSGLDYSMHGEQGYGMLNPD